MFFSVQAFTIPSKPGRAQGPGTRAWAVGKGPFGPLGPLRGPRALWGLGGISEAISSGWLLRVDGYPEWMAITSGWLFRMDGYFDFVPALRQVLQKKTHYIFW